MELKQKRDIFLYKNSLEKKGISPVIATILLISLTVVIGVIIFLWFRGMTQEVITKSGGKNIELVCDDVQFEVDYSNGKLFISNTGNIPIFGIYVKEYKESSYSTKYIKELSEEWPSSGINQGERISLEISFGGDVEKIILIPELIGNSEKGKKAFMCDEDRHGKTFILS